MSKIPLMKVCVHSCPHCSVLVVIPDLDKAAKAKTCPVCKATFLLSKSKLRTRDVPVNIALHGYFLERELRRGNRQ